MPPTGPAQQEELDIGGEIFATSALDVRFWESLGGNFMKYCWRGFEGSIRKGGGGGGGHEGHPEQH